MKTTAQKMLQGTFRKDTVKQPPTFSALREVPKPLDDLTGEGMEFYTMICQLLISNGILTQADIPHITEAAGFWQLRCMAMREIKKNGCIQTSQNGFTQKQAAFSVLTDSQKALGQFYRAYGLNYASRSKMDFPKADELYNELDELMNPEHKAGTRKMNPLLELARK
jgi:P27 family predicted phage terminase small subunit